MRCVRLQSDGPTWSRCSSSRSRAISRLAPSGHASDAPLFFIFHLLGDGGRRRPTACSPACLRCPSNHVDAAHLPTRNTENSHRVMAAVFDGDPAPIYNIILDENADEFVRSRMCETLGHAGVQGRLDRSEAASFLRDCWINLQPRDGCFVWHGWQSAIALLGTRRAEGHRQGGLRPADRQSRAGSATGLRSRPRARDPEPDRAMAERTDGKFTLFGDTIEELSSWYASPRAKRRARRRSERIIPRASLLPSFEPDQEPHARRRPQRSVPLRQRQEIQEVLPAVSPQICEAIGIGSALHSPKVHWLRACANTTPSPSIC